ncbi:hypothetical protein CDL15_Pgr018417 [Punica granatum]|uniref:Uncharacterized protein n=1 Tax=Punica granatum TaxID=22663 RepID=A0A218WZQ3_PUNGR|nr:hypothetical protein CDL15_Pgr018417 [Punica granatum]
MAQAVQANEEVKAGQHQKIDRVPQAGPTQLVDPAQPLPSCVNPLIGMECDPGVFVVDLGPFPITDLGGRDMEAFTEETSLEGTHDQSLDTSLVEIASETNPMVQDEQLDVQRCLRGH